MQTSEKGIAVIELEEGVVLKAYRCPAGKWTIGAGLTKASGVIDPKPGQVITREHASELLALALQRNYEPDVRRAMGGKAKQAEFDAGVSFHFNTGGIGRASWVKHWLVNDWAKVEPAFKAWRKGGGKVLPGLVRRRATEYKMLRHGLYPIAPVPERPDKPLEFAQFVVPMSPDERKRVVNAMNKLGYEAGSGAALRRAAVLRFQKDHDLTVDGLVGRATLSALQRRIDASRRAAGAAATGGAPAAADAALTVVPDWVIYGGLALGALALGYLAYTYRDVVAAKLQRQAPRLSSYLRSF